MNGTRFVQILNFAQENWILKWTFNIFYNLIFFPFVLLNFDNNVY
jgi:hypothetical protein